MALIACPACESRISDRASSCPRCGTELGAGTGSDARAPEEARSEKANAEPPGPYEVDVDADGPYAAADSDGPWRPGFFQNLGLVILVLLGVRVVAAVVESGAVRGLLYLVVAVACLASRVMRRAFIVVAVAVLAISVVVTTVKWRGGPKTSDDLRAYVRDVGKVAFGFGPGKMFVGFIEAERRRHLKGVVDEADRILRGDSDAPAIYSPYLEKVSHRDAAVRTLASKLTRTCDDDDHLCESILLLRYVTDNIKYRRDPRGGPDYVQSPADTVSMGAGDCEDQTILLVSLLESIGNNTFVAFTSDHVYPLVCYDRPLGQLLRDLTATKARTDRGYVRALLPKSLDAKTFEAYTIGGKHCYALEPTSKGSWLGFAHDTKQIEAVIDPVTRRPVRFR